MEGSLRELISYRMKRAEEMLEASKENLRLNHLRTSLNRSYYAVFHAIRAVNATQGFDLSKHAGVIAYFNKEFLKTEKLNPELSKIIKDTSYLREKSDYDDFYIASRADVETQLKNAETFLKAVFDYLNKEELL